MKQDDLVKVHFVYTYRACISYRHKRRKRRKGDRALASFQLSRNLSITKTQIQTRSRVLWHLWTVEQKRQRGRRRRSSVRWSVGQFVGRVAGLLKLMDARRPADAAAAQPAVHPASQKPLKGWAVDDDHHSSVHLFATACTRDAAVMTSRMSTTSDVTSRRRILIPISIVFWVWPILSLVSVGFMYSAVNYKSYWLSVQH